MAFVAAAFDPVEATASAGDVKTGGAFAGQRARWLLVDRDGP